MKTKIYVFWTDKQDKVNSNDTAAMNELAKNPERVIYFDPRDETNETKKRYRENLCNIGCKAEPNNPDSKCLPDTTETVSGCLKCDEKLCECNKMYPWNLCPVTCGYGIKKREVLAGSKCETEQICAIPEQCPTNVSQKFAPLDLVIIIDEAIRVKTWHEDKNKNVTETHIKILTFVVDNFELGTDKTRLAIYCSGGYYSPNNHVNLSNKNFDAEFIKSRLCAPYPYTYPPNLHINLKIVAEILKEEGSRSSVEKAVLGKK